MADSNEAILEKLKNGTAKFELVPIPSWKIDFLKENISLVIGWADRRLSEVRPRPQSLAMKKHEHFSILKVERDERSLFRALIKGMAYNEGISLIGCREKEKADELVRAVKKVLCGNKKQRESYEDAVEAIDRNESLKSYCERIARPDFRGGESELMVLSKLMKQPIIVYRPLYEHIRGTKSVFVRIAEYGSDFKQESSLDSEPKKVVRLLFYNGENHYDLLC